VLPKLTPPYYYLPIKAKSKKSGIPPAASHVIRIIELLKICTKSTHNYNQKKIGQRKWENGWLAVGASISMA